MTFNVATGPDGRRFVYTSNGSGEAVRDRLPRDVRRRLYTLTTDENVDADRLERLLAWAHARAREWFLRGPEFRARLQRFEDAQEVLGRFRRVAREMRRTAPDRRLDRLLKEAEEHFIRYGSPLSSPLVFDGVRVRFNRLPNKRPPEQWKARARAELRKAGVPAKLAPKVVTAIGRMVAQ